MKVAVDYQAAAGRKTGIGVFATNLFDAIRLEKTNIDFLLYTSGREDLNTPGRIWWESVEIPRRLFRDRPDLVYSPGFAPAMWSPVRQVVTVHDIIGMAFPQNQRGASKFYWSRWLPAALKRAHRLVASSEATRRDLQRLMGIDPERVRVVPLSAHPCFVPEKDASRTVEIARRYGLDRRPFMIAVGALEPRKNLISLFKAYAKLAVGSAPEFDLAIVGKPAGAQEELNAFVAANHLQERVHFLGYVADEDLVGLYHASFGYVTVSLYEGFGLPALEAMRCGRSGVSSNRSSLPEVVGDGAISVDPENTDQITEALKVFFGDAALKRGLEAKAIARSRLFSPEATARAMISVFEESVL